MTRLERVLSWTLFAVLLLVALGIGIWFFLPRLIPEGGITVGVDRGKANPDPVILAPAAPADSLVAPSPSAAPRPVGPQAVLPGDTFRGGGVSALPSRLDTAATPGRLRIPVAGVRPTALRDTYTQSRAQGRPHNAIDIPAPRGTPVVAAADGRVLKLFQSDDGGTALYQLDPDGRTVYYYAHLAGYAPGIHEGQTLRSGETLGYVGDTGNAGPGNYHLHFGVSIVPTPEQYWGGRDVNPYPLLRGTR